MRRRPWSTIASSGWDRGVDVNTRQYFRKKTVVRNVRRPRSVTLRERWESWRTRATRRDEIEENQANSSDDADAAPPREPIRWLRLVGFAAAAVCAIQVVYAAGVFNQYAERTQQLHVQKFAVAGQNRMTSQQIIDASGIKPGASLTALEPVAVQHAVESLPWIKSARVELQLPSTLAIFVAEYKPFALLLGTGGKLLIVDRGGFVFKQAEGNEAGDLPIITGLSAALTRDVPVADKRDGAPQPAGTQPDSPTQRRLHDLLHLLDTHAASPLAARFPLSEVHWDPVIGTTLISANDGAEIRLGHALESDLGRAFSMVGRLLDRIDARGEWLQYALMDDDLRPDRAVVRTLPLSGSAAGLQPGGAAAISLPKAGTATNGATVTPLAAGKKQQVTLEPADDHQID